MSVPRSGEHSACEISWGNQILVKIDGIGYSAFTANDIEAMSQFHEDAQGFKVLESDLDYGGVFLNLQETGHAIELFSR